MTREKLKKKKGSGERDDEGESGSSDMWTLVGPITRKVRDI